MQWYKHPALWLAAGALAAVAYVSSKANKVAEELTAPAGQLLSDLWAKAAGRTGIELQPLMIRPEYLDENYKLLPEAKAVLYGVEQYKDMLAVVFDNGGVMRPEYRNKIGLRLGIDK